MIAAFGREFAKIGILPRELHLHLIQAEQARIQSHDEVAELVSDLPRAEFPDPNRRACGEKRLIAETRVPLWGYDGIERVIEKMNNRR